MDATETALTALSDTPMTTDETLDEALIFARRLEDARSLLIQNPLSRPVLYRILKDCAPARFALHPLEKHIQEMSEYTQLTQPPYFLLKWLMDAQALDMFELDAEGADVTPERTKGLSEDEIDDLVVDFAFQTSEVGKVVLEEFDPNNRLSALLVEVPERYDTYRELLEFLKEKRTYAEVDELLRGRPILMLGRAADDRPIQPSVFIDKLAATGSIVFDEGWQVTAEGERFLERTEEKA
jgi:hypothetical protein